MKYAFVALNVKYLSTRNNIGSRNSRVELVPECDNLACVTGFIDNTVSIFLRADWLGFSRSCRREKGCSSCYCQLRVIFLQRIHSWLAVLLFDLCPLKASTAHEMTLSGWTKIPPEATTFVEFYFQGSYQRETALYVSLNCFRRHHAQSYRALRGIVL